MTRECVTDEDFEQAYEELDPNLEMTYAGSTTKGDPFCEHVFRYRGWEDADRPGSEGRPASTTYSDVHKA